MKPLCSKQQGGGEGRPREENVERTYFRGESWFVSSTRGSKGRAHLLFRVVYCRTARVDDTPVRVIGRSFTSVTGDEKDESKHFLFHHQDESFLGRLLSRNIEPTVSGVLFNETRAVQLSPVTTLACYGRANQQILAAPWLTCSESRANQAAPTRCPI